MRSGRIDPDDACRTQSTRGQRDRNDNGCPDREFLKPEVQLTPGSYCRGSLCLGLAMDKLVVSQIPRGTRVSVSCSRKACRTASKRAGRSRRVRFFSGQKLRAGVKVFVKVTKKGRVGRQVTYLIKRNDLHKGRLRCLSGGRATGCSTKLLIR